MSEQPPLVGKIEADVIAIAHRGDPVGERENTVPAFAAGVRLLGADMIELDLRRTKDGEIVVLHDQTLERLWGLDRSVGDLNLAEVESIGEDDLRIPTFRAVLAAVELPLMVDFTRREVVEGALGAVLDAGALDRCLFVTGNVEALRILRDHSPEARIGLTWIEGPCTAARPAGGAAGPVLEPEVRPGDARGGRGGPSCRPRGIHMDGRRAAGHGPRDRRRGRRRREQPDRGAGGASPAVISDVRAR